MLPKTTDINKQSETLLPQIQITNKRLTQMAPNAAKVREKRTRQFVFKPQLDAKTGPVDMDTNTDGADTDGGGSVGIEAQLLNSQVSQSKDSSNGGFIVLKNGQLALKQQRRMLDQFPTLSKQTSPQNRLVAPLPKMTGVSRIFLEGEITP